jgi:hypothetical protein
LLCIYRIRLPEEQDAEAFVKFMREELLADIKSTTPTRIGGVSSAEFLRPDPEASHESGKDDAQEFFLQVIWNGVGGCRDDAWAGDEVLRKLESFGARLHPLGPYYWVGGEGF